MHVNLVVPAYNEAGNLRRMVERTTDILHERMDDWTFGILLVVSANSTDGTEEIARDLDNKYSEVTQLVRTGNYGFGNAIKDGLRHADGDVLIPFMADLSDDPADIPQMIAKIREGYDVVYGSRFMDGGSVDGYPPLKLLYNRGFNNVIRLLFGIREKDVTNAFTAYRSEVINEVGDLHSESFDLTAELPLRATVKGFRITEVPVSWRSREEGVSKLNATKKGPVYIRRVLAEFVRGNVVGLSDLFTAVTTQSKSRILGAVAIGIILLVTLLSLSGYRSVFDTLQSTNLAYVSGIVVVYLMSFVFRTWRWRVLLRASEHLASRTNAFRCIMAGWFLNSLIPARAGDVLRGYGLKITDGIPFSVAVGTIVIERILDMFVLGTLMLFVTTYFLHSTETAYLAWAAFGIAIGLLVGLVVVYSFGDKVSSILDGRIGGIDESIATVQRSLHQIRGNPFALALSTVLSIPVWFAEIGTIYFAGRAIGLDVSNVEIVAAGISGFVSQAVPITPGGLGTYETAITSVLTLYEVPSADGYSLALLDHFTRLAIVYIVGAVSVVHIVFQSRPYFRKQQKAKVDMELTESTELDTSESD